MSASAQPGWYPDPLGRYHYRYYDGTGWTANVSRDGVATRDGIGLAPVGVSAASVTPANLKPSIIWYWTACALATASIVLAIVLGAVAIVHAVKKPEHYARTTVPGKVIVPVENTGTRIIYYEGSGSPEPEEFDFTVTGPDGQSLSVYHYDSSLTYDVNGHSGEAIAAFHADHRGNYEVEATQSPTRDAQITVGPNVVSAVVRDLVPALLVFGIGVLAAIALAVTTLIRRRASRIAAQAQASGQGA